MQGPNVYAATNRAFYRSAALGKALSTQCGDHIPVVSQAKRRTSVSEASIAIRTSPQEGTNKIDLIPRGGDVERGNPVPPFRVGVGASGQEELYDPETVRLHREVQGRIAAVPPGIQSRSSLDQRVYCRAVAPVGREVQWGGTVHTPRTRKRSASKKCSNSIRMPVIGRKMQRGIAILQTRVGFLPVVEQRLNDLDLANCRSDMQGSGLLPVRRQRHAAAGGATAARVSLSKVHAAADGAEITPYRAPHVLLHLVAIFPDLRSHWQE